MTDLRERAREWIAGFHNATEDDRANCVALLLCAAEDALQCAMDHKTVEPEGASTTDKIRDLRDVQGQNGTWNASGYMRGLYNGLELALSILEGERDPQFKDAPAEEQS